MRPIDVIPVAAQAEYSCPLRSLTPFTTARASLVITVVKIGLIGQSNSVEGGD